MSVFRHAVMRQNVHHTLATLHHKVLAVGAFWDNPKIKPDRPTLRVAVARQRRHWFEGLWASAGEPVTLKSARNLLMNNLGSPALETHFHIDGRR